jgi:two-component sensor histidine kinase
MENGQMQALIDYASYMPHGYCLFWQPWLVFLFAGSDLLIFLSYSAIPFALLLFLKRRPDVRYRGLVVLFAAFILLCGVAHLVSIVTLWIPVYPLHGLIKLITGIVSAITALVLFWLVPRLVAIPSPEQLQRANEELRNEIAAHQQTLASLREAQRTLEEKVDERTAALVKANDTLAVMTREAVHRSKNLLSLVSSIARQTARDMTDVESFVEAFSGRIIALANAGAALIQGADNQVAALDAVASRQLEPVLLTFGDRVRIDGPQVAVGSDAAQQLALVLHELATNAQKHGALRSLPEAEPGEEPREQGRVDIEWRVSGPADDQMLALEWRETDAQKDDSARPSRPTGGFGQVLLDSVVPAMLSGAAERHEIDGGFVYRLTVPVSALAPISPVSISPEQVDRIWSSVWLQGEPSAPA